MASLSAKIIILALILAFPFGQLLRLNLFHLDFPLIDLLVPILALINLIVFLRSKNRKLSNRNFLYFLVIAWVSYLLNGLWYSYSLKSIFYLIRLSAFISFFIIPLPAKAIDDRLYYLFRLSLISSIAFGFLQYFFWPDFTYFNALNWDPHLYRLVGSFFDPTFTALIFLFFLISCYFHPNRYVRLFLTPITYLALVLTYSRSSYLSLFFAFLFIGYKKKDYKLPLVTLLIILLTIVVLPRQEGEGTKLERSSSVFAKIENYKEGIIAFTKSPIIGYGYNNLDKIRPVSDSNSHSTMGYDSSLLTILTTIGTIGFVFFLLGFKNHFASSNLNYQSLLIALTIHSLFANSLLYPWVLLYLIFVYPKNRI